MMAKRLRWVTTFFRAIFWVLETDLQTNSFVLPFAAPGGRQHETHSEIPRGNERSADRGDNLVGRSVCQGGCVGR
jgi:hypothetical protein